MITQLDERGELLRKVEGISSADDIQRLKVFIAGMEAGRAAGEKEFLNQVHNTENVLMKNK